MRFCFSSLCLCVSVVCLSWCARCPAAEAELKGFIQKHCVECHDADTKKGDLDLVSLSTDFGKPDVFGRWAKVHDRVEAGEMPPAKKARPAAAERAS